MKFNERVGVTVGAGILVIIAITTGISVWEYERNQPDDMERISMPTNNKPKQLSDVEQKMNNVYESETYGFQFKIPENLITRSNTTDNSIILSETKDGHWVYSIHILPNPKAISLKQAFIEEITKYSDNKLTKSDTIIGGKQAKRYSIQDKHDYGNAGVLLIHENNIVSIVGDDSTSTNREDFESFLNTFRFTE